MVSTRHSAYLTCNFTVVVARLALFSLTACTHETLLGSLTSRQVDIMDTQAIPQTKDELGEKMQINDKVVDQMRNSKRARLEQVDACLRTTLQTYNEKSTLELAEIKGMYET